MEGTLIKMANRALLSGIANSDDPRHILPWVRVQNFQNPKLFKIKS